MKVEYSDFAKNNRLLGPAWYKISDGVPGRYGGSSVFEATPAAAQLFYKEFMGESFGLTAFIVKDSPYHHRLCLYWLENTLKPLLPESARELVPDYVPVYFTALHFLANPV